MPVCPLFGRHTDGGGPGVGQRTPVPAVHPSQLPGLRVP